MTRDEIVKAFPNYIRKDKNGNIDTSAAASFAPYLGEWLMYPILGYIGKTKLYFDTTYHLAGYECEFVSPIGSSQAIISMINDSLVKIYDSTYIIGPDNRPGFVQRITYYRGDQKMVTLTEKKTSIIYSEGQLIDIIIVPRDHNDFAPTYHSEHHK